LPVTVRYCKSEWETQLHEGYPATVEGQAKYMKDFINVIENIPNGKGISFYYWEPAWIPSQKEWSVGHENGWSNLALFDFEGKKLDSLIFKNLWDRTRRQPMV
jgi:arabinogalactan endo-1,4-beta-galactosidase